MQCIACREQCDSCNGVVPASDPVRFLQCCSCSDVFNSEAWQGGFDVALVGGSRKSVVGNRKEGVFNGAVQRINGYQGRNVVGGSDIDVDLHGSHRHGSSVGCFDCEGRQHAEGVCCSFPLKFFSG